jgi:hypothetical protein
MSYISKSAAYAKVVELQKASGESFPMSRRTFRRRFKEFCKNQGILLDRGHFINVKLLERYLKSLI